MLTDAAGWFAGADVDSPWRRLHWTLPLALLIAASALFMFSYSMESAAPVLPKPQPIDAQIVQLPPPAQAAPAPPRVHTPPPPKPDALPEPAAKPVPKPPPPKPKPAPKTAPPPKSPPPAPVTQNQTAQAVMHPMPPIPDDLREDAMNEAATARFHIAPDGSATVELIKPTMNPRLNRFLLRALSRWHFNPALQGGKPVASVEDLVIRVSVQ